ncbi:MAG: malate synthase [Planctomycetota bacterium]|jgi:malate synthase
MTNPNHVDTLLSGAGVELSGTVLPEYQRILTPQALSFVADLERAFGWRRKHLLQRRVERQAELDRGVRPDFLPHTSNIRSSEWTVAPLPKDLEKRVVEITGPVERKMVINALNSDADVFMADFEDSNAPTWSNIVDGQINLFDAVRGEITFTAPGTGKHYELGGSPATLLVRPRGWHLEEKHVTVDGQPISAALFDFGLYFFHNAKALLARDTGPYFYLPKLESHLEARLWNDVFIAAQEALDIPVGTIKATVLIETILASFEMHEILYELREHSAGLNCGRWDYIFSYIKRFSAHAEFVLPDRSQVGMDAHFLHSYSQLLIQTCHRRGVHAMGGMAAQIPIKNDDAANQRALDKVRADKTREANNGHDGTWVAHPALAAIAREEFDKVLNGRPNQLDVTRDDVDVNAADLIQIPTGSITEAGLRQNLSVGVQYLNAWLSGNGCVPLYNLMEDAATAEISRTQVWQWIKHEAHLDDGRLIDAEFVRGVMKEELAKIRENVGADQYNNGQYEAASQIFGDLLNTGAMEEFLTLPAYERIVESSSDE